MRSLTFSSFALLSALLLNAHADEPKTPAEKFQALVKAQRKAERDFSDAYQAAKSDEDRKKASAELGTPSMPASHAKAFLALMKEHPKDPVALDALDWLITRAWDAPEADQAIDIALRDWIDDVRLANVIKWGHRCTPATHRLLRGVFEKSSQREVRGYAHFTLAQALKGNADRLAGHRAEARDPLEKEADELLQKVIDTYADLKRLTTLGEEAEQLRFELRNLGIGKAPPDIEGEDLDGKKLKLSDHRGKVTLVVFWAGWCGPCMGDVPHERELLKQCAGKPFAIVGVNGDKGNPDAQAAVKKAEIPWRSFADYRGGPITKRWNVDSWPTLYLLDGRGTIRFKGDYLRSVSVRAGKDGKTMPFSYLDEAVEQLMKEAEKKP